MQKKFISVLLLAAVLLTACTATPAAAPAASAVKTTAPVAATAPPAETAPAATQTGDQASNVPTGAAVVPTSGPATCQQFNLLDQVLSPPNPNLKPASDADWVSGNATAAITITDYSDFQ